eukprot:426804_1
MSIMIQYGFCILLLMSYPFGCLGGAPKGKRAPSVKALQAVGTRQKYLFPNFSKSQELKGNVYPRPRWNGMSDIIIETDQNRYYRLTGTVFPISVGDRGDTVGTTPGKTFNGADVGQSSGYERGHVLGLRLGGPNHPFNIAAQTSGWQGTGGEWYKLESKIFAFCMECYGWKDAPTYKKAASKPRPRNLCNIQMSIVSWQGRSSKIPRKYEIEVSCGPSPGWRQWLVSLCSWKKSRRKKCKKKKFKIEQPLAREQKPLEETDSPDRDDFIRAVLILMLFIFMYWFSMRQY